MSNASDYKVVIKQYEQNPLAPAISNGDIRGRRFFAHIERVDGAEFDLVDLGIVGFFGQFASAADAVETAKTIVTAALEARIKAGTSALYDTVPAAISEVTL